MKFIELLCTRLRWTSDQVEQIILQNLPGRLASALLRLTDKHKLAPGGRTIAVTQQEISEMVGMTRESINKQLRVWAARNCLLMLSRDMPTISLISCWVTATVRPAGSSLCFSVRRISALASRPGRF